MLPFVVLLFVGVLLDYIFFCIIPESPQRNTLQNATVSTVTVFCPIAGLGLLLLGYEKASHNSYLMLNASSFLKSGFLIFSILFSTIFIFVWDFFKKATPHTLKKLRASILLATLFPVFLIFGSPHYLWPIHSEVFSKAVLIEAVPLIFIGIVLFFATFHRNFIGH